MCMLALLVIYPRPFEKYFCLNPRRQNEIGLQLAQWFLSIEMFEIFILSEPWVKAQIMTLTL